MSLDRLGLTFNRVPACYCSAGLLCKQFLVFILSSLYLLHTLVMIEYSNAEDFLCSLLSDYILVQVLLEKLGSYVGSSNI